MPKTLETKLVSRITRRNSTIEIWSSSEKMWVSKAYHARYQVRDEAKAYEEVAALLVNIRRLRTAAVYNVDETNNVLELEYVAGPTIAEKLSAEGGPSISEIQDTLLDMLVCTHEKKVHLDLDPSNLILDENSDDLVLIDPICANLNLSHFSAVVFLWGMIKRFVVRGYRVDRWLGNAKAWGAIYGNYAARTNCPPGLLSLEMGQYIDTVIKWNIEESSNESLAKRLARWAIIIPTWWVFRFTFLTHAHYKQR